MSCTVFSQKGEGLKESVRQTLLREALTPSLRMLLVIRNTNVIAPLTKINMLLYLLPGSAEPPYFAGARAVIFVTKRLQLSKKKIFFINYFFITLLFRVQMPLLSF